MVHKMMNGLRFGFNQMSSLSLSVSSGSAGEQVALHQSGRPSPLGQAEERPIGRCPVQTANQAASEERLSGVAGRSENIQ